MFMHNCAGAPNNIMKSAKQLYGSIGISFDNGSITKGD